MKTVSEALNFFADVVEAEQELSFNMRNWFETAEDSFGRCSQVVNVCGTSACIAGTVAFHLDPTGGNVACDVVERYLGIPIGERYAQVPGGEFAHILNATHAIWHEEVLYGVEEGEPSKITKEIAVTKLREWAKFESWEDLSKHLN